MTTSPGLAQDAIWLYNMATVGVKGLKVIPATVNSSERLRYCGKTARNIVEISLHFDSPYHPSYQYY